VAQIASVLAVIAAATGVVVERWFFLAEAKHVMITYYEG
jgi:DMSO reductase anchor subunit